jgi:rfaE bifunctional protein nucleotidyltransferase chain/domain
MSKKKTVFTNGCFDILHRGHIELLKFCKGMGKVVVGLNSDSSVSSLKGPTRPVFTERDRKFMLESCRYVDEVRIFEEDTPYNLIKVIKPDIIVKGSDYEIEDVVGNDLCKSVILFNYVDGYSTTQIIKNLSDR